MSADAEKLFDLYRSLAAKLANRMRRKLPPSVSSDEIHNAALYGLWDACQRFDPALGYAFNTFAGRRIHGAMIDYLRQIDPLTRRQRRDGTGPAFCSIEAFISDDGHDNEGEALPVRTPPPWYRLDRADLVRVLTRGLRSRTAELVRLVFIDGKTMAEAGQRLGISQARVSQILKNARPLMAEALARQEAM